MNIAVLGLWHLGCVTAACCAKHFRVAGLDFDDANVANHGLRCFTLIAIAIGAFGQ